MVRLGPDDEPRALAAMGAERRTGRRKAGGGGGVGAGRGQGSRGREGLRFACTVRTLRYTR
jgi:hypothetical protein